MHASFSVPDLRIESIMHAIHPMKNNKHTICCSPNSHSIKNLNHTLKGSKNRTAAKDPSLHHCIPIADEAEASWPLEQKQQKQRQYREECQI